MSLLRAEKYYTPTDRRTNLHHLVAILSNSGDWEECYRDVAANIEKLRDRAPFAYLIANGKIDVLFEEWQHLPESAYYKALEGRQLKRGGCFGERAYTEHVETVIFSAGLREIRPCVSNIYDDFYQILCLPTLVSLEAIDEIVYNSASTEEAILKLLENGGFIVSCVDYNVFKVLTMDASYKEIFSDDSP